MERNAHYLIVGAFVAAVLTMATVMLVWMAGSYDGGVYKRYSVYFEGSVSGLSEGSVVSYRGVNVGHVISIAFDPDRPERIHTIIDVEETTPISASSSVSLKSVGITGLSALSIKTETAGGSALEALEGDLYPVIPSERSGLSQLISDAPQITDSAVQLLARMNTLLSEKNIENLGTTLENIESASASLNMLLNEDNAKEIAKTLGNLSKTTARLDKILANNTKQIDDFTGDGLNEISILVKDTQEMVAAFKILAQKLSDDPSQILYKPNYEGVKVPQ